MDEHTKLARVAVSFDPRLDEAFRINVAKMRVQLPQQLREQFEKAIGPVIKIAQTAYRRSAGGDRGSASPHRTATGPEASAKLPHRLLPPVDTPGHSTPDRASPPSRAGAGNGRLWTMEELRQEAERVATTDERPVIRTVFDRLIREKRRD
jgi:hypothetical protein